MKRIIYILILLILTNCRYFNVSPVDGITTKNLINKPAKAEMIGIWEVDKLSYELNEEKGYKKKKIELELKQNGTFEITNFPNYINVFEQTEEKFVNTRGNWKIEKDFKGEKWVLIMDFDKSNLYKNGMSTTYELYLQNNKIIIWNFIGDPDSGNRFLFLKNKTD